MARIDVLLEEGTKRTFAVALDWAGWARSGKGADAALEALRVAGPRYASVLRGTRLRFAAPKTPADLRVVERVRGDATTDFGAPGALAKADRRALDAAGIRRQLAMLHACWRAFDRAAGAAEGIHLRTGPRGGGRTLEKIRGHVNEADAAYLSQVAMKPPKGADVDETRAAIGSVLSAARDGTLPATRPRGGAVWPPRYFVRRVAWHVLDHAWEIEDRID
jgi:hypothetical protein